MNMPRPGVGRLFTVTFAIIATLISAGCGSRSGSLRTPSAKTGVSRQANGGIAFAVKWPSRSRLIPLAANSIKVALTGGPKTIDPKVITRPADGGQTIVRFEAVPVGTYMVTVTAHPNADGTGTPQAKSVTLVTVESQKIANAAMTLDSTIHQLHEEKGRTSVARLKTGYKTTLSVSGQDESGATVVTSSSWTWSSSNPAVATVTGQDGSATVAGIAPGTATVTVTEAESGRTLAWNMIVIPSRPVRFQPWAFSGGNHRNSASGPSAASTGAIRWEKTGFNSPRFITADEDIVSVRNDTPRIEMLDPQGSVRWAVESDTSYGGYSSVPMGVGPDTTIYVLKVRNQEFHQVSNAIGGSLVAYSPDGQEEWTLALPEYHLQNGTVRPDGTICLCADAADGTPTLLAVGTNGELLWTHALQGPRIFPVTFAVANDNTLYVLYSADEPNGDQSTLEALSPSGERTWSKHIPGLSRQALAVGIDGTIYYVAGNQNRLSAPDSNNRLVALAPNGDIKWTFTADGRYGPMPISVTDNNIIVLSDADRKVWVLNGDGSIRWQTEFPAPVAPPAGGSSGEAAIQGYFTTAGDAIYIYALGTNALNAYSSTGALLWSLPAGIDQHGTKRNFVYWIPDSDGTLVVEHTQAIWPNSDPPQEIPPGLARIQ